MIQQLQKPGVQMGLLAVVVMIAAGAFYLTKRAAPAVNAPPVVENKKGEVSVLYGGCFKPQIKIKKTS